MNPSSLIVWRLLLLSICVLCSLSPSKYSAFREEGNQLIRNGGASLSGPAQMQPAADQGRIGSDSFQLEIKDNQVFVFLNHPEIVISWQSPREWRVREAFFSDLNRDGEQELSLLVWREYRPWPVDRLLHFDSLTQNFHNGAGESCQLILLKWKNGTFKEAWAGSALAAPIHDLQVLDLDGDRFQELAALEQSYDVNAKVSSVVVWRWNGFGFSLDTRLEGRYTDLWTLYDQKRAWLVIR